MRTTIDINDNLLTEVMRKSGAKTKKTAIVTALKQYLKQIKTEELKGLVGHYDEFGLTAKDLKKMRNER